MRPRPTVLRTSTLDPRHAAHDRAVRAKELAALKQELDTLTAERTAIEAGQNLSATLVWGAIVLCAAVVLTGVAYVYSSLAYGALGLTLLVGFFVVGVIRDGRRNAALVAIKRRLNGVQDRIAELAGDFDHGPS